jgi:hypothetical protein
VRVRAYRDRAPPGAARPAFQGAPATAPARCRRFVFDAASIRRGRARLRPAQPDDPVSDGKPGEEIQHRYWMDDAARARRAWSALSIPRMDLHAALVALPVRLSRVSRRPPRARSRHARWRGSSMVVVPDNTRAIVHTADPLKPRIVIGFLEYAQARGFEVDPTRKRHPRTKLASSEPCATYAMTASPARSCLVSTTRVHAGGTGAPTSTACVVTRPRSDCHASTSRPSRSPRSSRRQPSRMTFHCGPSPRSRPISTHRSRAPCTRCRASGLASSCGPGAGQKRGEVAIGHPDDAIRDLAALELGTQNQPCSGAFA